MTAEEAKVVWEWMAAKNSIFKGFREKPKGWPTQVTHSIVISFSIYATERYGLERNPTPDILLKIQDSIHPVAFSEASKWKDTFHQYLEETPGTINYMDLFRWLARTQPEYWGDYESTRNLAKQILSMQPSPKPAKPARPPMRIVVEPKEEVVPPPLPDLSVFPLSPKEQDLLVLHGIYGASYASVRKMTGCGGVLDYADRIKKRYLLWKQLPKVSREQLSDFMDWVEQNWRISPAIREDSTLFLRSLIRQPLVTTANSLPIHAWRFLRKTWKELKVPAKHTESLTYFNTILDHHQEFRAYDTSSPKDENVLLVQHLRVQDGVVIWPRKLKGFQVESLAPRAPNTYRVKGLKSWSIQIQAS